MVIDLSGKICLVTGASRGLGKGIAVQLAVHGAQCYVTGRNEDLLQELNKEVARGDIGRNLHDVLKMRICIIAYPPLHAALLRAYRYILRRCTEV